MYAVELVNVTKKFGSKVVLNKVNLAIGQGEFVAITGKSGKGKTTILNLMGMFERESAFVWGGSFKAKYAALASRENFICVSEFCAD